MLYGIDIRGKIERFPQALHGMGCKGVQHDQEVFQDGEGGVEGIRALLFVLAVVVGFVEGEQAVDGAGIVFDQEEDFGVLGLFHHAQIVFHHFQGFLGNFVHQFSPRYPAVKFGVAGGDGFFQRRIKGAGQKGVAPLQVFKIQIGVFLRQTEDGEEMADLIRVVPLFFQQLIAGVRIAPGLAHFGAIHLQVKVAEDVRQLQLPRERRSFAVGLTPQPHSSLHENVKENIVLAEELVGPGLGRAPEFSVFFGGASLLFQGQAAEGDGGDQGLGPDVESLSRQIRVFVLGNGYAPGSIPGDGPLTPRIFLLNFDSLRGEQSMPLTSIRRGPKAQGDALAGSITALVSGQTGFHLFVKGLKAVGKRKGGGDGIEGFGQNAFMPALSFALKPLLKLIC